MTNKPTVAEFFAQYAEKGQPFYPHLKVRQWDGTENEVLMVSVFPNRPIKSLDGFNRHIDGRFYPYGGTRSCADQRDIVAVLDDAGNVIAGEV